MVMAAIREYYNSNIHKPFFAVIGDEIYQDVKSEILKLGVEVIRISDCCHNPDKKPDLDILGDKLRTIDIDFDSNKVVVLGLGEYLALEGEEEIFKELDRLKDFNLGNGKAVILLRGVHLQIKKIADSDPRFDNRKFFLHGTQTELQFVFASGNIKMYDIDGFKNLLKTCEEGASGVLCANTNLNFQNSILPIKKITSSFDALKKIDINFKLEEKNGSEEQWNELLAEVEKIGTIDKVFKAHNFEEFENEEFHNIISGNDYVNWLYYIFLLSQSNIKNAYIKYVLSCCDTFDEFKRNILYSIIDIPLENSNFKELYLSRKSIVRGYTDPEIAQFVVENKVKPEESIYRLTDNTIVEKEEIISYVAQYGIPKEIDTIYPALSMYMSTYHFEGQAFANRLTAYFEAYKRQKIRNSLEEDFLREVDRLAETREYNRLQTRDELVANIDKKDTYLCWIDALGVEYLAFIVEYAKKRELNVKISVGRAELPTITPINKRFYDNWPDNQKIKVEELDEIKHKEKGGYKFGKDNPYAKHLARELEVISEVLDHAATDLKLSKYSNYVIASDHGASRLAVLRNKEEKYSTDTRGEHSGRCCKTFSGYDLPFATEENGYIVLADYGRFEGSRRANVEVHGGASLEEVLVPIIELSNADSSLVVKLVEETVTVNYKQGAVITLFVNKIISDEVSLEIDGSVYNGKKIDDNHYNVEVPDIKKAGKYNATVKINGVSVSTITIKTVGKSASVNDDFDDLF